QRLQSAQAGARVASKLGCRLAGEAWLVDLVEAGTVLPVPPLTPVPLAQPWFRGVANIRGNLYSVTDFSAFARDLPTAMTEHARLLIIAERFRVGAALLVERAIGLRSNAGMQANASSATPPLPTAHENDT